MTKDKLKNIIDLIKQKDKIVSELYAYNIMPELFSKHDKLIDILLDENFKEAKVWIDYYIYELNFGKDWKEGMINMNGKSFEIKDSDDLYDFLKLLNLI